MKWLVLILCLLAGPVFAVQPGEMLADPVLEARARDISKGLRCLVCQNESIDESHATLAHDLRVLVRERLIAGDSDAAVVAFVVDRYGEFVLLRPRATGSSLLLWLAGPVMLAAALAVAAQQQRKRRRQIAEAPPLDAEELARIAAILRQ